MSFHFEGIRRLDWGFDNPNMTAALIAMIAIAVLGTGLVWKRAFWVSLLVGLVLLVALYQTLSRGGMVAFGIGFVMLLLAIRPHLSWYQIISILAMFGALFAYASLHGGASRYVQGLAGEEDRSISNRWLIYKSVPSMIVDAPQGWGIGKAPDAYHQWYQPEGRSESYLNLVNSHFTWLVEWPTWGRLLYGLGWGLILIGTWPRPEHRWWGIVMAVWLTFFVAASFSSVAHRPWMWPFPVLLLLFVMIHRIWIRKGFSKKDLIFVGMVPVLSYFTIAVLARSLGNGGRIYHEKGITTVGPSGSGRKIALCGSESKILGERFGHRIRGFVRSHAGTSVTFYETPTIISPSYQDVVLVGNAHEDFRSSPISSLWLLNPSAPTSDLDLRDFRSAKILWGAFNPSPAVYAWRGKAGLDHRIELVTLQGEGLFLENWLNEVQ